jgi:polysaccharide biosynthesis transport protein
VRYNVLRRQVEADRVSYARITDRLNETVIASQLDHINIKPVDTAEPSYRPVEPNIQKIILQSAFLGAFIFLGLPLGLGLLDQKLKAAWEVEFLLGLPLLGEIPKLGDVKRRDRAHLISQGTQHAACETFRGIFTQLELNTPIDEPRMILITSTVPGEGKTIVASNLAATFATHGKRTIVVDCDFRRPALHHYYERKNDRGIIPWLERRVGDQETISAEDALGILQLTPNFHLLRAGGESRNPTEMLNTSTFRTLLQQLREEYDIILIDTPPVGVFPDALLLARSCDQLLYVCQFNRVNKTQIRKFMEKLEMAKVDVGGLILNGIPQGGSSVYYDYFGYGQAGNRDYKAYYARKAV